MTLVIQTNTQGRLHVWICDDHGHILGHRQRVVQWHGAEFALGLVDRLLIACSLKPRQVRRVLVVRGPGAFSAVRIGLVLANTFGYVLNIPVRGVTTEKKLSDKVIERLASQHAKFQKRSVRPWYGKEPNISQPKRRYAKAR
ncbi:MAG: hypothetical protein HY975_04365 [Candidatus Kerfeldbacteria bacterium]|nr:hypothetical protein [Candidatus Kerfeldbacteria bacterium]